MPKIHLFNPENDLALANGCTNYLPPRSALKLKNDLALLPMWYAEPGDMLIVENGKQPTDLMKACCPDIQICRISDNLPDADWNPWGWNPALIKHLLAGGVKASLLPSPQEMRTIRELSSRERAVEILADLNDYDDREKELPFTGHSVVCYNEDEVCKAVHSLPHSMLKAPWSGSGKGLRRASGIYAPPLSGWCKNTLSTQGCVVVEPYYNKVRDLAAEFYSPGNGEKPIFIGFSLFHTDGNGVYKGNELQSDDQICQQLEGEFFQRPILYPTIDMLKNALHKRISPHYKGYLGIDMMVCNCATDEENPCFKLHPCVEVNLRMNMGIVAHRLTERLLMPGKSGMYHIAYMPQRGELLQFCKEQEQLYPPVFNKENRLQQGFFNLTPVAADTHYLAYVHMQP